MTDQECMAILLGLISSIIRCIQLHVTMLNVHGEYMRKRMNIMKMHSVSTSQKIVLKSLKKKPARPPSSIGRSHITKQCACSTPDAIILPPFLRLRVDRRKRFEYGTCGRNFFQKRRKNLRSQRYPHTCGQSLYQH